jgi:competence protein ComEA
MRSIASFLVSSGLALSALAPFNAWSGPVDINTADAGTLARELNGVGPARAKAIVTYRTEHGPFKSVDDLRLVKNVPQKLIDNNRDLLRVDGAKPARADARPARADSKTDTKPDSKATKP